MPTPWAQVASSPGYQSLPPDQQAAARAQYFDQVVAPKVPAPDRDMARQQFEAQASTPRQAQAQTPQGQPNGAFGTFMKGAAVGADKVITGGEELLGKGLQSMGATGLSKPILGDVAAERARNQASMAPDAKAHPWAAAAGDLAGGAAITGGGAGLLAKGPVAASALAGAFSGATDPVDQAKNFWTEKAKQIGIGTVAGGALGMLGEKIAPAVKSVSGDAKELLDAGIKLTPGQMAGGVAKGLEEKATSIPITGHFVGKALEDSRDSFNIAMMNKALDNIGAKLPAKMQAGRPAIDAMHQAISKAYDTLLPQMTFRLDKPLEQAITKLRIDAKPSSGGLQEDAYKNYENYLKGRIIPILAKGNIPGPLFKKLQEDIGKKAGSYASAQGQPFVQELGESLKDLKLAMDEALERQNPNFSPHLKAVNRAFAMAARIEGAAGRRAVSEGKFTPGDLLASIKTQDKSVRKNAFARGDAFMQPFAEKAQKVMGNRTPDSGTTGRLLAAAALHGGGANTLALLAPKTLGPLAAGAAAYTKPGTMTARYLAQAAPGTRKAIAKAIPGATPFGAPGAADLTNSEYK